MKINMEGIRGKKLLILGATAGEISLVQRAQEFGAYVIVTDYHSDFDLSPAKRFADEAWNVSWSDIDKLEVMCQERRVDGVTAGYSEFRIESMIKLCGRLGLPSYATMEQLEITRDKVAFKDACRKYGVPVVNEYADIGKVKRYPVIVKPVDRAGSIGISIAVDKESLDAAFEHAMDMSICKRVIIEDYIYDATKVDFYYAIEDGRIELISSCDTINAKNNGFSRVVQSAWLYPEKHLTAAMEKVDVAMRRMIRGLGIQYGCIFFSGFVDKNEEYVFFECGFRLEGGHQYGYTYRRGLMNFLDIFILHALKGNTKGLHRDVPYNPALKCVTINLYAKKGQIKEIIGMNEIAQMPDCSLALTHARIGQVCEDNKAILSKIGMFSFCNESPKQLRKDVDKAYSMFKVVDIDGKDMLYDRIDSSCIETWWE